MQNDNRSKIKKCAGFLRDEAGAIAIVFALSMPMVMTAAGVAVDLAQAYNVKNRLADSLDKAALAGGSTHGDADEVEERVTKFFEANFPAEKLGTAYGLEVLVNEEESTVTVSANAKVDMTFMSILGEGFDYMTVTAESKVKREVRGLEVVMVLDNTGSMDTNDNIATLRTASTNFINILFDATNDPEDIRIGMVPYSSSVRVGRYGLGLNADGTAYGDGTVFVTLPSGVSYTTNRSSSTGWYGCVVDHKSSNYSSSATHVSGSYGQLWRTSTQCSNTTNCRGHGWSPASTSNDPYPDDIPDDYQGPWDIYMYGTLTTNCSGTCNPKYTFNKDSTPNRYCPYASVFPLSSDRDSLLTHVGTMRADGATLSNVGMAWGYRILSADEPFTEGSEWGNEDWRKAVLMMTDGETSMGGNFTSYWATSKNNIDNAMLDDRMLEICNALKEQDVTIYTVTFAAGVPEATKEAYRQCATSEDHYYDAPSQDDLIDTFEEIARQLSQLRIVQ